MEQREKPQVMPSHPAQLSNMCVSRQEANILPNCIRSQLASMLAARTPTFMGVSRQAAYASTVRSAPLKAYTVRTLASACCAMELASANGRSSRRSKQIQRHAQHANGRPIRVAACLPGHRTEPLQVQRTP